MPAAQIASVYPCGVRPARVMRSRSAFMTRLRRCGGDERSRRPRAGHTLRGEGAACALERLGWLLLINPPVLLGEPAEVREPPASSDIGDSRPVVLIGGRQFVVGAPQSGLEDVG